MSREHVTGAAVGVAVTASLGWLWYRHWSAVPEIRLALRSGETIPLRLKPPYPEPTLPSHDHWTWASDEEVETAFQAMDDRRLSEERRELLRQVDRDQWCGNPEQHRAHHLCGGVVPVPEDARPTCRWTEVHDAHYWRDVEREGHQRAKPRYCGGRPA